MRMGRRPSDDPMRSAVDRGVRRPGWRGWRAVVWVLVTTIALMAGCAATLLTALVTVVPAVFLAVGAATTILTWAALFGVIRARRTRRGLPPGGRWEAGSALVVFAAVGVGLLVPLHDAAIAPSVPRGAASWTLTDGNHIAYGVVRADPGPAAPPVVIVHGGPGVPDLARELAALGPLSTQGRDVYAYAQVGSGRSSRLDDPSGYTVQRAVDNLEQIRRQIGTPSMVLVGHSYGAYLVAAYLRAHPHHVAAAVFSSPGGLRNGLSGAAVQQALTLRQRLHTYALLARPRALLAYGLVQVRPQAAHAFAGDAEMDARNDRVVATTNPALHCPDHPSTTPPPRDTGFYANQVPQSIARSAAPDLRGSLPDVPALIVKGQCDYLPWDDAVDYLDALPGARIAYLRGAGHSTYVDRPAHFLAAVRAFLAGRSIPGVLAEPRDTPPDYQPGR